LFADGYGVGCVGGQWDDRSASASTALGDAWLGSGEVGWVKVHCAVPGVWLAWAAPWLAPDASTISAGDAAATKAIASRARIFAFMLFPIEPYRFHGIWIKSFEHPDHRYRHERKLSTRQSLDRTFDPELSWRWLRWKNNRSGL